MPWNCEPTRPLRGLAGNARRHSPADVHAGILPPAPAFRPVGILRACFVALALVLFTLIATPGRASNGWDLAIGGPGTGHGSFSGICGIAFDTSNNLYVLDAATMPAITFSAPNVASNFLVQVFSNGGAFLSQFSVYDPKLGANNAPAQIAVDSKGLVYVTEPAAGLLRQYSPSGTLLASLSIPAAQGVAVRTVSGQEQIVVASNPARQTISQIQVVVNGKLATPIALSKPVTNCIGLTTDSSGDLYLMADVFQLYEFSPAGKLITILGSGVKNFPNTDGSLIFNSCAVDSKGTIYGTTTGNPSYMLRFDPGLQTYEERQGEFAWNDSWGWFKGWDYMPFAIDHSDRLWMGVNGLDTGSDGLHVRPCVIRTVANFFTPGQQGVIQNTLLGLGLYPSIASSLPYNVSTALQPINPRLVIGAATRRVQSATARYQIYDVFKDTVASGTLTIPLTDSVQASVTIPFSPPKWGWYELECQLYSGSTLLKTTAAHFGATPEFSGMPTLSQGESTDAVVDAARQAFVGLKLIRTSVDLGLDTVDEEVTQALELDLTPLVQLTSVADCSPASVSAAVTRFKGRVKYWEVVNEPDGSMQAPAYVALLKSVSAQIKQIDPNALVVAPATCSVNIPWLTKFYAAGGGPCCDVLSVHDYEGNETIDPITWEWAFGQLRQLMAANHDSAKPVWQTERAISGVRGGTFLGTAQAFRVLLHRDILEALGVPSDQNNLFYMDEHGYSACPTYIWSAYGPHPAALALRTRAAMLQGMTFQRLIDMGPTGNKLLLCLGYSGKAGSLLTLHNLGSIDAIPVTIAVTGTSSLTVTDCFGNQATYPVTNGAAVIPAPILPVYVEVPTGATATPQPINFGQNMAPQATLSYSTSYSGALSLLTNGVMPTVNPDYPNTTIWTGALPGNAPQALTLSFPSPREISKMLVFGVEADNSFCALLDFDIQAYVNSSWVTVKQVRTPCPASDPASIVDSLADTWYLGEHITVATFNPTITSDLRLVVYSTTFGFLPDALANAACDSTWGMTLSQQLQLRQLEVYP